jgi:hypothetical protein
LLIANLSSLYNVPLQLRIQIQSALLHERPRRFFVPTPVTLAMRADGVWQTQDCG